MKYRKNADLENVHLAELLEKLVSCSRAMACHVNSKISDNHRKLLAFNILRNFRPKRFKFFFSLAILPIQTTENCL